MEYDGATTLHSAAFKGNVYTLLCLLNRGADINSRDEKGETALHYAAFSGKVGTLLCLLKRGADINSRDNEGQSALHWACNRGHFDASSLLLSNGGDIHCRDNDGYNALFHAAFSGNVDILSFLLNSGAAINTRDNEGRSVLHAACVRGNVDALSLLRSHGVDIHCRDKKGASVLHSAALHGNVKALSYLLDNGADLHSCDTDGDTVLSYALEKSGKVEAVSYLISIGSKINAQSIQGHSPLHIATKIGNVDIVSDLLLAGADANLRCYMNEYQADNFYVDPESLHVHHLNMTGMIYSTDGFTPVHRASFEGRTDILSLLVRYGGDINIVTDHMTVLHLAAVTGHSETLRYLLPKVNDQTKTSNEILSLMHLAALSGSVETLTVLYQNGHGIDVQTKYGLSPSFRYFVHILVYALEENYLKEYFHTPLHSAASENRTGVLMWLLENGAQVNARCSNGATPLMIAERKLNADALLTLLQHNADANLPTDDDSTPLHFVVKNQGHEQGHITCCNHLIAYGARTNTSDYSGSAPLHYASSRGEEAVVSLLLENTANVNLCDINQETPVFQAVAKGHANLIALLAKYGANLDFINKKDLSVLHISADKGNKELTAGLLENGANVNNRDSSNETPLHHAIHVDNVPVVVELIWAGADVNIWDKDGNAPIHQVTLNNQAELLQVLVQPVADKFSSCKKTVLSVRLVPQNNMESIISLHIPSGVYINAKNAKGFTALHIASKEDSVQNVISLIMAGAIIDSVDSNQATPLFYANNDLMAETLIHHGANINARDCSSNTVIHYATKLGNLNTLRYLLRNGGQVNAKNQYGAFPIHSYACVLKSNILANLLTTLLKHGTNVDARDNLGATPLHHASKNGNIPVITELFRSGCERNVRDKNGSSALFYTAKYGKVKTMKFLINAGLNVNARNAFNETPLYEAVRSSHEMVVRKLIASGAQINIQNKKGDSPLLVSVFKGDDRIAKLLLHHKADANMSNSDKRLPIHAAAITGNVDTMLLFIDDTSSTVNKQDELGYTLLHHAASRGNLDVIQLLVQRGANINCKSKYGLKPVTVAANHFQVHAYSLLVRLGAEIEHDHIDELFVNQSTDTDGEIDVAVGILYTTKRTGNPKTFSVQRAIYDLSAFIEKYESQIKDWKSRLTQLVKNVDDRMTIKMTNPKYSDLYRIVNRQIKDFVEELPRKYPNHFAQAFEIMCTGSVSAKVKVGLPFELDFILLSEDTSSFDSVDTFYEYVLARFRKNRQFPKHYMHAVRIVDTYKTRVGACIIMQIENCHTGDVSGVLVDLVPAYRIPPSHIKGIRNPLIMPAFQYLKRHAILKPDGELNIFQLVSRSRDYPFDFGCLVNEIVQNMNDDQKMGFRVAKYLLQNIVSEGDDLHTDVLEAEESLRLYGRKQCMKSFYLRLCLLNILIHTDGTELGKQLTGGTLTLCLLDIMHKTFLKVKTFVDEHSPESFDFSFADPMIGDFRLQYHLHWSKEQVNLFVRRIRKIMDVFESDILTGDISRYKSMNYPSMDTSVFETV